MTQTHWLISYYKRSMIWRQKPSAWWCQIRNVYGTWFIPWNCPNVASVNWSLVLCNTSFTGNVDCSTKTSQAVGFAAMMWGVLPSFWHHDWHWVQRNSWDFALLRHLEQEFYNPFPDSSESNRSSEWLLPAPWRPQSLPAFHFRSTQSQFRRADRRCSTT